MPRLSDEIKPLLAKIAQDVGIAWSVEDDDQGDPIPIDVYIGAPRTQVTTYPFAVVQLESLPATFETMRTVIMDVTVRIYGFFTIPDTTSNLDMLKLDRADELIALLEANSNYNDLASLPYVKDINLPDEDESDQYRVEVVFSCQSSGAWGA